MNKKEKEEKVYNVFQSISEGYDDANTRISLGMEKFWKRRLINLMINNGKNASVLDVCCGTGDIAIAIRQADPVCRVVGLDFSPAMLAVAKKKCPGCIEWVQGNAMELPFPDSGFDAVCISFGLRNTPDYRQVLSEMKRVVKPGGVVACLDSFVPENEFIKFFYNIYFKKIMPVIGGLKDHKEEYEWLADSTEAFLRSSRLKALFEEVGLTDVSVRSMMCGACCLHKGLK